MSDIAVMKALAWFMVLLSGGRSWARSHAASPWFFAPPTGWAYWHPKALEKHGEDEIEEC